MSFRTLVLPLVVALAVSALGCASPDVEDEGASAPVAQKPTYTPPAEPAIPGMGDPVEIPNGQLVLGQAVPLEDKPEFSTSPGNAWVAVQVKYICTSSSPLKIGALDFSLDYPGSVSSIPLIANSLPYLQHGDITPGSSAVGWIALQMRANDVGMILHYTPAGGGDVIDISLAKVWSGGGADLSAELATESAARDLEYDTTHVDMAEYEQIQVGMSLAQVSEIVGWDGEESASSGSLVIRTWQNPDGSGLSITFSGNRVDSKAQVGL